MKSLQMLRGLYLLAAMVLSLQTFAVWHDVEHPFHQADLQCERLEAISHAPVVDQTPVLAALPGRFVQVEKITPVTATLLTVAVSHQPIRGPPHQV